MSSVYVVFRIFGKKERPEIQERSVVYGWSSDKNTVKAFLHQRSPDKYDYCKFDETDQRLPLLSPEVDDWSDTDRMIDYVKLKVASTKEEIRLYLTPREMREAEKRIQRRFHEMCSISDIDVLMLFMNLDRYYLDALELLGFRPKEVDLLYDSCDSCDDYNTLARAEEEIEDGYSGESQSPYETFSKCMNPPGLGTLTNVSDKILYSVENFVTALREDL